MGNKSELKQTDRALQMMDREEEKVKSEVSTFYDGGILATFKLSSEQSPLVPLLAQARATPNDPQAPTQSQLAKQCLAIRSNVKAGKPNNIEIQFNKCRQLSERCAFQLGNTAVKLRLADVTEPRYFFIKAGDTMDSSIFFGGDNAVGIMLIRDENGDDYFLRLSEFHMLSLRADPDPHKEVGLMCSFVWLTANVYSSVVLAPSLDPIKNLLLSEWLQAEWQRAKDAASKPSGEVDGGDRNG